VEADIFQFLPVPFRYPSGVRTFGLPLSAKINTLPFPFRCSSGTLPVPFRCAGVYYNFIQFRAPSRHRNNSESDQSGSGPPVEWGPPPPVHKWQLTRMFLPVPFQCPSGDTSVSDAGPESRPSAGLQGRLGRQTYAYREPSYPYPPCLLRPDVVPCSKQCHMRWGSSRIMLRKILPSA